MTGDIYDRMTWLTAAFFASMGCGSDPAASPARPGADSGAAPLADSGSPPPTDGGAADDTADGSVPSRPPCQNPAIPEGELQNRATGPSVFGQAVGGDAGWFDALGGTECGLAGVRICQMGTDLCTDSDEAGQFVLGGLPEGQDIEITFEKAGGPKVLRLVHTSAVPINLRQTRLINEDSVLELFDRAGVTADIVNLGALVAISIAAGEGIGGIVLPEGVVVTLNPSGPAPLYSVGSTTPGGLSSDELDPALLATRAGGWTLFANVEPGDYTVRFERNGQVCDQPLPGYGYGADAEGNMRAKIVAGWSTSGIAAFCP